MASFELMIQTVLFYLFSRRTQKAGVLRQIGLRQKNTLFNEIQCQSLQLKSMLSAL